MYYTCIYYCNLDKIDNVQNRALRLLLGVHKCAPNLSINADMGWIPSKIRRHTAILRMWNRSVKMEDNRLTKKVFFWDKTFSWFSWCSDIDKSFNELQLEQVFYSENPVNIDWAKEKLFSHFCEQWPNQMQNVSRLCTCIKFKSCYGKDPYVCTVYNHGHRAILPKFRSGILPLSIETGHFQNIRREFRLCTMCNDNVIEDETHFIFYCNQYNNLREYLYEKISPEYLYKAYCKRRSFIYN